MKTKLFIGIIVSQAVVSASNLMASTAASIFSDASGTAVTYDNASGNYPVVEAILSQPGTLDGYTYSTYSLLVQDSTGAMIVYGSLSGLGYTPTVGDAISVSATYSPFHQIPELASSTAITLESSGNALAAPTVTTIPTLIASGTGTIPQNLSGQLLTLDNVTLYSDAAGTVPISGDFPTHANDGNIYAKDGSGNIIEIYDYASSFSDAGAFGGTPIPTGTVDITGLLQQSGTFADELIPISIASVPEPTTLALAGVGAVAALIFRRRNAA
jgi:hypothetical protein